MMEETRAAEAEDVTWEILPHGNESGPRNSCKIACSACRQSKHRCEPTEDKEECRRCHRLGLLCEKNTKYKRKSKSRKLEDLENQLHLLTSRVAAQGHTTDPFFSHSSGGDPSPFTLETGLSTPAASSEQLLYVNSGRPLSEPGANTGPLSRSPQDTNRPSPLKSLSANVRVPGQVGRALESVRLTREQTDVLFDTFYNHFHPFIPFLDSSSSPDDTFQEDPCLFWSIVAVAARRYREDATLLAGIAKPLMGMIWKAIATPPYNTSLVSALVLLSTWPFPPTSTYHDPAVTICAISHTASFQIGLHRPLNAQDFQRRKLSANQSNLQSRINTWAAVNITAQMMACALMGHPVGAPFDQGLEAFCKIGNVYTIAPVLQSKTRIGLLCQKVNEALEKYSTDGTGVPPVAQLQMLSLWWQDEIEKIGKEYSQQMSVTDQLHLLWASVFVYSNFLLNSSLEQERQDGVLKSYDSALHLIKQFADADERMDISLYAPSYIVTMMSIAGWVVFKVLKSSYALFLVDPAGGERVFKMCISSLARASVENNDTAGKAAKMLTQLWYGEMFAQIPGPPELRIRTRRVASIFYDFVWAWREEFQGHTNVYPAPEKSTNTSEIGDILNDPFMDDSLLDLNWDWNIGF